MIRFNPAWTSVAQVLAILLMVADHAALWLSSGPESELYRLFLGRGALPLFAAMIAWHALRVSNPYAYAVRVAVIAMIAQPAYAFLLLDLCAPVVGNICWIFVGAILLVALVRSLSLWFPTAFVFVLYVSTYVEYGIPALFLVLALALAFRWPWLLPVPALAWPFLQYGIDVNAFSALVWMAVLSLILSISVSLPRLPRVLTRSFYPLHLYFIFLLRHVL